MIEELFTACEVLVAERAKFDALAIINELKTKIENTTQQFDSIDLNLILLLCSVIAKKTTISDTKIVDYVRKTKKAAKHFHKLFISDLIKDIGNDKIIKCTMSGNYILKVGYLNVITDEDIIKYRIQYTINITNAGILYHNFRWRRIANLPRTN